MCPSQATKGSFDVGSQGSRSKDVETEGTTVAWLQLKAERAEQNERRSRLNCSACTLLRASVPTGWTKGTHLQPGMSLCHACETEVEILSEWRPCFVLIFHHLSC